MSLALDADAPDASFRSSSPRIAAKFAALRTAKRAGLVTYLQAFDPDASTSAALLQGLPAAGADLIELGMPFTDPMADGPAIQAASRRALGAGASLRGVLRLVRGFRETDALTPVVLMGYLNPVLAYGMAAFCADAVSAGADGVILVDLPAEEADLIAGDAAEAGLDVIRLVAPTTDDARLPGVLRGCGGFVYYVAIAGITGTRSATTGDLAAAVPRVRQATDLPVAVGFGVRTPEQARAIAGIADAVVVGSALIDALAGSLTVSGAAGPDTVERVLGVVRGLARAVRG